VRVPDFPLDLRRSGLVGFQEVPVISTTGAAHFAATISRDETEIAWEMSHDGLEGTVTQSHIHFGQAGVAGGISLFLCTKWPGGEIRKILHDSKHGEHDHGEHGH
jgi:hypothetical protein